MDLIVPDDAAFPTAVRIYRPNQVLEVEAKASGPAYTFANRYSMWIDNDFPALAPMNPEEFIAQADFMAQAKAESERRQQKVEDRKAAAIREFAQLSAQHPIDGYDRNVMQQWIDAGACGRRPQLSFELRRHFRSDMELMIEQRARQLELKANSEAAAQARKRRDATKKLKSEKIAAALAAWDAEHPGAAAARNLRKGKVRGRRFHEAEERKRKAREEQELEQLRREYNERLRLISSKIYAGGKQALLELDEQEFDLWCTKIATIDQLEAFGEDLFKDSVKVRERSGPWLWRMVRQAHELARDG